MSKDSYPRPKPSSSIVSEQMQRMPRKDSTPEVALRRELHARGLRFRLHLRRLPGSPDIVLTRAKIAVFVDGCFWHRCPEHGVLPKANGEWWLEKLNKNVERDRRNDRELRSRGWEVIRVWEHEAPESAADQIENSWRTRTGRIGTLGINTERHA